MPVEGLIAKRARSILPTTWDALLASDDGEYTLQSAVDLAKQSVFGVVVSPVLENSYPLLAIDYTAKLAVIEIITPAIDYWMSMPISVSIQGGGDEVETVTDRAVRLKELREQLVKDTRAQAADILELLGTPKVKKTGFPKINTMDDEFLTPSPQEFTRPYTATDRS